MRSKQGKKRLQVVNNRLLRCTAFAGQKKDSLQSVVHYVDTQVCGLQAEELEAEASKTKAAVVYAIIGMDLAFA
jgi:peroxiredoxin